MVYTIRRGQAANAITIDPNGDAASHTNSHHITIASATPQGQSPWENSGENRLTIPCRYSTSPMDDTFNTSDTPLQSDRLSLAVNPMNPINLATVIK